MMVLMRAHAVVVGAELDQLRRRHRAGCEPLSRRILDESRIVPIGGCLNDVVRGRRMDGDAGGHQHAGRVARGLIRALEG